VQKSGKLLMLDKNCTNPHHIAGDLNTSTYFNT